MADMAAPPNRLFDRPAPDRATASADPRLGGDAGAAPDPRPSVRDLFAQARAGQTAAPGARTMPRPPALHFSLTRARLWLVAGGAALAGFLLFLSGFLLGAGTMVSAPPAPETPNQPALATVDPIPPPPVVEAPPPAPALAPAAQANGPAGPPPDPPEVAAVRDVLARDPVPAAAPATPPEAPAPGPAPVGNLAAPLSLIAPSAPERPAAPRELASLPADPAPVAPAPADTDTQAARAPGDWVLQFGAFRSRDNAERLVASLRGRAEGARVETAPGPDGRDLHYVRAGAFADAEAAAREAARLAGNFGLDSYVTRR